MKESIAISFFYKEPYCNGVVKKSCVPGQHLVKMVLASGPPPFYQYPPLPDVGPDPWSGRTQACCGPAPCGRLVNHLDCRVFSDLAADGVYDLETALVKEGVQGLDDKSHARKAPRVVTMEIANEIRKKQENPLIGEWRMHAGLLQEGIKVSPRTCGRIMAKRRAL
jgi:putative transposase